MESINTMFSEYPQEFLHHSVVTVNGSSYQLTDCAQDADSSQYPVVATAPAMDALGNTYQIQWVELDTYRAGSQPWEDSYSRYDFSRPAYAIITK